MAAPRKKKKTPPFDVTGIDFSVITTALATGGKMIEQIINGIQYGSPEVRLLMLEECEVILECRVCRALFRALPNFIAHKRVYCKQAYCNFTHNQHFQSATAVIPPEEEVVVVEPEDVPPKNLRPPAQQQKSKDKGKEPKMKDVASASTTTKKTSRAQASNGKGNGQRPGNHSSNASGTKTRSQQSEKMVADTVHQIEEGKLGKSQEYAYYTAAAEKAEKDRSVAEQCESIHLTPISSTPHAVFVNLGSVPCDQAVALPAPSQECTRPASTNMGEKQQMKHSPKEGSTPVANQEPTGNKIASETNKPAGRMESTAVSCAGGVASALARKRHMPKSTPRNITKVVKELRQNKEQTVKAKEESVEEWAYVEDEAQKNAPEKSLLLSLLSTSKPLPPVPVSSKASVLGEDKSSMEEAHLPPHSATPSPKFTDQLSITKRKEGDLCAVVRRRLTGRTGTWKVSPLKCRERNTDSDTVSEAGSYSEREGTPSALWQDGKGNQGIMNLEKKLCKLCDKMFSTKKSLMYHCRCRHSGQRTIFPCPYCPRVFYYLSGLTRHLNQNHKKSRSDIDRMRKALYLKAYRQTIPEEEMAGAKTAKSGDHDGKSETAQKFRPSVRAKKMVAISKSVTSVSGEIKKGPPTTLNMPSQRRRVEVIASVRSKPKKLDNVYKRIYTTTSKKTESPVGSPVENSLSPPRRTRKLVTRALHTTRSKRVYNCVAVDWPLNSPEKETKKATVTKNTKAQSSSKIGQNPVDVSSSISSVSNGKEHEKDAQNILKLETSTPLHKDSEHDCQKTILQLEESKVHNTAVSDVASNCSSVDSQHTSEDKVMVLTIAKQQAESELKPQTRTRTSSVASDVVLTPVSPRQNVAQAGARVSKPAMPKETSPQALAQVKSVSVTRAATSLPESSGVLHICAHCQQAFGRQISLNSHLRICGKANPPLPTSQPNERQPAHTLSESQGKTDEDAGTKVPMRRGEVRRQVSQERSVRTCARTLRESSVEKSKSKPKVQHKPSAQLQDPKLKSEDGPAKDCQLSESNKKNARTVQRSQRSDTDKSQSTSSRENSKDRQIKEKFLNDSKSVERPSRSCKTADSKPSTSRDGSVDCVRTRRSDCKPTQLPAERSSRALRRESEYSQDSLMDSHSQVSNHDRQCLQRNLLVISRQRLSEHLLAATTGRDKDISAVKTGKTESCRDSHVATKKNESGHMAVSENSPDKSVSQRTVTTSVLRKNQKGKMTDFPKKASLMLTDSQEKSLTPTDSTKKPSLAVIDSLRKAFTLTVADSQDKKSSVTLTDSDSAKKLSVTPTESLKKPSLTLTESPKKSLLESLPGTAANPASSVKKGSADPRASNMTARIQDTKIVFHSVKTPAFQKEQILAEKITKKEQSPPAQPHQQTVTKVSSSTLQPQENPSEVKNELNQRPRRKRRAPARVMDSEILLPKSLFARKRSRTDANVEDKDLGGESLVTMVSGSEEDRQGDADVEKVTTEAQDKVEKKTGRSLERGKSRTYVVEPTRSKRLTCQCLDMRKVEEIMDRTGLKCLHCNMRFASMSNLCRHAIRHLGWKRFKCRLCCFSSYGRSECNTHLLRTHFKNVAGARTDPLILDLSRQAATLRNLKKRQTMNSRRQLGEDGESYTVIRKRGRRARASLNGEEDSAAGSSSTPDVSTTDAVPRHSASGEKMAMASPVSDSPKTKPSNTFNISTRNSPRQFDTRPYPRNDNPSALNTHKESCTKRTLSFSQNTVQEEDKIVDTTTHFIVLASPTGAKGSDVLSSGVKAEPTPNKDVGSSVVVQGDGNLEVKQESNMVTDQEDMEALAGCDVKSSDGLVAEKSAVSMGPEDTVENQGEEIEFVVSTIGDSDLMKVEELQNLPVHFMSDEDD